MAADWRRWFWRPIITAERAWSITPLLENARAGNADRLIHGPFLKLTITGN